MLRGGMWVSATQVLGTACATLSQLLLARLLAPEALGAFYLVQSIVVPAGQLGQLGMPRPLTRLVAQAEACGEGERVPGIIGAALQLALGAGLIVALLYLLLGDWVARSVFETPVMTQATWLAAIWTLVIVFQQISAAALRGLHRVGAAAFVAESGAKILMAGGLGAMLLASGGPRDFATVLGIAVGAAGAVTLLGLGTLAPVAASGTAAHARGAHALLVRASLPLVLTAVVHVALNGADLWIVGAHFASDQVALYGAAKRLILIVGLPLMLLPLVIPPVIADLHARGELERLERVIRGSATLGGLPAIPLLLVFALASEPVLGLAFGEFYRGASTVLVLLCIERLVFVWAGPCSLTLLMTGHETAVMKLTVGMGIATVALVYLGVLLLGFIGAAVGFVAGSVVHQLLTLYAVQRLVGIRTNMTLRQLPQAVGAVRRALSR